MHRRLGKFILDANNIFVFEDDFGGKFPIDDPGKDCFFHHSSIALLSASRAASFVFHTETNLPLWQKIAPLIPETISSFSSARPAHARGRGFRPFILAAYDGGIALNFQPWRIGMIINLAGCSSPPSSKKASSQVVASGKNRYSFREAIAFFTRSLESSTYLCFADIRARSATVKCTASRNASNISLSPISISRGTHDS